MGAGDKIVCNVFSTELHLMQRLLSIVYLTDLPPETRVIFSCDRYYSDCSGDRKLWPIASGELFVGLGFCNDLNGGSQQVDIDVGDKAALDYFNSLRSAHFTGISSDPSNDVHVVLTVGARQRLRGFGKNNSGLIGNMVRDSGEIRVIRVESSIYCPMLSELNPLKQ
jgi:hypothetical protein